MVVFVLETGHRDRRYWEPDSNDPQTALFGAFLENRFGTFPGCFGATFQGALQKKLKIQKCTFLKVGNFSRLRWATILGGGCTNALQTALLALLFPHKKTTL